MIASFACVTDGVTDHLFDVGQSWRVRKYWLAAARRTWPRGRFDLGWILVAGWIQGTTSKDVTIKGL